MNTIERIHIAISFAEEQRLIHMSCGNDDEVDNFDVLVMCASEVLLKFIKNGDTK